MSRSRGTVDHARAPASGAGAPAQPLIHNMSCRPTFTVTHKSAAQCRRLRFSSPQWPAAATAFADYCPTFGLPMPTAAEGYARLVEAAAEPCPLLARLPPVAAVLRNAPGESIAGLTDDPRVLLAVMSRCFGSVFMRDLPPSITSDSLRLQVTLLIPKSWNLNP
jgi:hypothetical protein